MQAFLCSQSMRVPLSERLNPLNPDVALLRTWALSGSSPERLTLVLRANDLAVTRAKWLVLITATFV